MTHSFIYAWLFNFVQIVSFENFAIVIVVQNKTKPNQTKLKWNKIKTWLKKNGKFYKIIRNEIKMKNKIMIKKNIGKTNKENKKIMNFLKLDCYSSTQHLVIMLFEGKKASKSRWIYLWKARNERYTYAKKETL